MLCLVELCGGQGKDQTLQVLFCINLAGRGGGDGKVREAGRGGARIEGGGGEWWRRVGNRAAFIVPEANIQLKVLWLAFIPYVHMHTRTHTTAFNLYPPLDLIALELDLLLVEVPCLLKLLLRAQPQALQCSCQSRLQAGARGGGGGGGPQNHQDKNTTLILRICHSFGRNLKL